VLRAVSAGLAFSLLWLLPNQTTQKALFCMKAWRERFLKPCAVSVKVLP